MLLVAVNPCNIKAPYQILKLFLGVTTLTVIHGMIVLDKNCNFVA